MKAVFLCALNNITSGDLKNPLDLCLNEDNFELPTIKITNKISDIKSFLTTNLKEAIGTIEYEYLCKKAPFIAYCESEFNETENTPIAYLNQHLDILSSYLFSLWCIKDNSVDFDLGFLQYSIGGKLGYSNNLLSVTNFTCKGESTQTHFSSQELRNAVTLLQNNIQIETKRVQSANTQKHSRITIANYYIQHARSCSDLGLKITSYCSTLECLFSNDSTELSHKLSERVALFLSDSKEERIKTYRILKQAYTFRSKVVHGDKFKEDKIGELCNVIKEVDTICRKVINYAFSTKENNIFEYTQEKHEEYFLDLLMTKESII